jgi:hypothetical protein
MAIPAMKVSQMLCLHPCCISYFSSINILLAEVFCTDALNCFRNVLIHIFLLFFYNPNAAFPSLFFFFSPSHEVSLMPLVLMLTAFVH